MSPPQKCPHYLCSQWKGDREGQQSGQTSGSSVGFFYKLIPGWIEYILAQLNKISLSMNIIYHPI